MKTYESIKAIAEAVKSGELDESKIRVVMDNDKSTVSYGEPTDPDAYDLDNEIYSGKGYIDVEDLWPLVFPKALVEWC